MQSPNRRRRLAIVRGAVVALGVFAETGRTQQSPPRWTVAPAPEVTIDEAQGENGVFTRIIGLARLSGDRIAVISRGTQDIRVFTGKGEFIRRFGGTGDGPGEYRSPAYIGRRGDTLYIHDHSHRRVTAQDMTTPAVRSAQLPQLGNTSVDPYAITARGTLLAVAAFTTSMRRPDGLLRYQIDVLLVDPTRGWKVDTLGRFPWLTSLALNPEGKERAMAVGNYPFGPNLSMATVGEHVVLADGSTPVVRYFDVVSRSAIDAIVPIADRPFDLDAIATAGERAVSGMRNERDRLTVGLRHDRRYLPKQRPFIRGVLGGPDGELWVEEFREDLLAPAVFTVLDSARRTIARVSMPPSTRVFEVGRDRVLAVQTNEDDVERVVVLRYGRR